MIQHAIVTLRSGGNQPLIHGRLGVSKLVKTLHNFLFQYNLSKTVIFGV